MTREQLNKEIELTLEQNRAAIERADNYVRRLDRLAELSVIMDRIFRDLHRAVRR